MPTSSQTQVAMSDFTIGKFQVVGTLGSGAHSTILHVRRELMHREPGSVEAARAACPGGQYLQRRCLARVP